eukprot:2027460-Prymnesium_polylepis.1
MGARAREASSLWKRPQRPCIGMPPPMAGASGGIRMSVCDCVVMDGRAQERLRATIGAGGSRVAGRGCACAPSRQDRQWPWQAQSPARG